MPELTEEQRSELPKTVITRALGMQEHVADDLQSDDTLPGDIYVLCSDGLSGMIEDDEIQTLVGATEDLDDACRKLVALANEHGGEDNITALIVRIEQEVGDEPGISLSDTLPTPLSLRASRPPPPPDGSTATADTPPAGAVVQDPNKSS
jgi:protein phosphatase